MVETYVERGTRMKHGLRKDKIIVNVYRDNGGVREGRVKKFENINRFLIVPG